MLYCFYQFIKGENEKCQEIITYHNLYYVAFQLIQKKLKISKKYTCIQKKLMK